MACDSRKHRAALVGRLACFVLALQTVVAHAQQAPVVLKHTPPEKAERDRELVLRANIVAAAGAYLPTLYYRPKGEQRFYSLPMLPVPGSLNIYAASVPGLFVTKDLEYYLESYDTQLRGPATYGGQKKPVQVPVVDPEVPPSQVVIRSDPPDAELIIDGKPQGRTTWLGIVTPGTHELLLKKEGFLEAASTLDVPQGRDLDLRLSLTPAAEQAQFAVTSDPSGATVSIDGQELGVTPLIAPSPDGEHKLTVEKKGYARAERVMLFSKERSIETTFTLTKLPPEPALAITTDPPGAKVLVDDKELGKTPFLGVVPSGEHTLLLRLEGRRPAQAQIIMPEDRDLDLRFTLEEEREKRDPLIAVSSDPPEAKVFIDDQDVGVTPYINVLKPGQHKVKLTYPGFLPYEKKINMPETNDVEVTLALIPEPPKPGPSKVTINSQPAGVEVIIDGKAAGKTPLEDFEVKPGAHVVVAKKDGFRSVEERFKIKQSETIQLKLTLEQAVTPEPILTVKTEPAGAKILVDGKEIGTAPYTDVAKPGKHKLVLSLEGYKNHEETFELPNESFELSFAVKLEQVRKTVQLASAAELKKEAEKPKVEIVKKDEVKSATTAAAAAAATGQKKVATLSEADLREAQREQELLRRVKLRAIAAQRTASRPQVGPMVLAGAGVLVAAGGVWFMNSAAQTATEIAAESPGAARADLVDRHTFEVRAAIGFLGTGLLLAAGGAVWAAWPKKIELEAEVGAAQPPAPAESAPAPATGQGGGGDVALLVAPTPGGGALAVTGTF